MTSVVRPTRIADAVVNLSAGTSPSCDVEPPGPEDYGVLTVAAVTSGRVARDNAKRIEASRVRPDWPVVRRGTILVNRANGSRDLVGACVLVEEDNERLILPDKVWSLEVDQRRSPRMLIEFLRSAAGRKAIHKITRGSSGMWNIPQDAFLSIPYPNLPEQLERSFDDVARSLDKTIGLLGREIAAKRTFKRGLMQQLLTGQRRFPEFRNRRWHSSRLAGHVTAVTRRNAKGLALVLTASGEHGLVDQRRYFNRSVAGADITKYYLLRKSEFAYNRSAMNGYPYGATKRLDGHDEGALSTLYLCFAITDPKLDSDFLKHVFESGVLNRQLRPIVRVGARAHGLLNVTEDDYLSISIPLPEIDEQRRIAAVLNDLDREIGLLAALRDQIALQKRALLSKLLSGEIPVPA